MPESLHLLPSTPQIKGLHTFIRNQDTPRDEFIFYSKRLIRLVIEYALGLLPFKSVEVDTPQGVTYKGRKMACDRICGVSILRAGETMEQAVCDVCKDITIGKILIQTNQSTGEPEVSRRTILRKFKKKLLGKYVKCFGEIRENLLENSRNFYRKIPKNFLETCDKFF